MTTTNRDVMGKLIEVETLCRENHAMLLALARSERERLEGMVDALEPQQRVLVEGRIAELGLVA